MKRRVVALSIALAVGGCASGRGNSSVPGVTPKLAERYGCSWSAVESNWNSSRMAPARPGMPLCAVLGRYGAPFTTGANTARGMKLLSLQYHPAKQYIRLVAARYEDTKVNRSLHRPVGLWVVQSFSVTR